MLEEVNLYLLDSDIDKNNDEDRDINFKTYMVETKRWEFAKR